MNYDFLQNYNIPIARQNDNQYASSKHSTVVEGYGTYSMQSTQGTSLVNTGYYGYGGSNTYSCYEPVAIGAGNVGDYYKHPERFVPPSKNSTGYMPYKTHFKRKYNAVGGGVAAKREAPIAEITADGELVIFLGRDESYPAELNSLIHPLSCDLCNIKMNSRAIAKDHYESKAHDKHISSWLFKNYTQKGINPPSVKRFIKQGPTGPDAFYCEPCDLKLTSLTHANQHYAGRKHSLVIAQRTKPSGAGFYNSEGKWVRTKKKITPNPSKDESFGIGDSFKYAEILKSTGNLNTVETTASATTDTITSVADTTTTTGNEVKSNSLHKTKITLTANSDQDQALFCSFCKVSATSAVQMTMHLSGSKHMKKLKLAGLDIPSPCNSKAQSKIDTTTEIAEENKPDPTYLSMYRTPSGQYYCNDCNTSISHLPGLEQHLKGKRHLRRLTEEKAKASLAAKKS